MRIHDPTRISLSGGLGASPQFRHPSWRTEGGLTISVQAVYWLRKPLFHEAEIKQTLISAHFHEVWVKSACFYLDLTWASQSINATSVFFGVLRNFGHAYEIGMGCAQANGAISNVSCCPL